MTNTDPVPVTLDLIAVLRTVPDRDKLRCVQTLVENIESTGVIDDIRAVVNDPCYDD